MTIEWRVEPGLTAYPAAVAAMEDRAAAIRADDARELIWLVEHPPLYTAGTSATPSDLRDPRLPVFASGRGGKHTYHGPGQRVVYLMLDLDRRGRDIRRFVTALEDWLMATIALCGVPTFTVQGRVGVWTGSATDPAKIAAIGVRVRRWVTLHGAAINIAPDLANFSGIVPCGLAEARVTSIASENGNASLAACDSALATTFPGFMNALETSVRNAA